MSELVAIEKPVRVTVRGLSSGEIAPKSFVWQGKTHYVSARGRQWSEWTDGKQVRCYLVQTPDMSSYELRWDPVEDRWSLHCAWLMNRV